MADHIQGSTEGLDGGGNSPVKLWFTSGIRGVVDGEDVEMLSLVCP